MKNIALIPARSGSTRIPNKNSLQLAGYPMIAYTISAALASRKIDEIIVSTDGEELKLISEQYGAKVPGLRPSFISGSSSSDLEWIKHAIDCWLEVSGNDQLIILRPTNPLRSSKTIDAALDKLSQRTNWHSLRAVRPVREHPNKMWRSQGEFISPYRNEINPITGTNSHSSPMQTLEPLLVQDASLEICKVATIIETNSISGTNVIPFQMPGSEGFDVNYPADFEYLKYLISTKSVSLPPINLS